MSHIFSTRTRVVFLSFGLVVFLSVAGLILTVKIASQRTMDEKSTLMTKVEKSADLPLRIIENQDAPLRVIEARSKEISAADFTRLTGAETKLPSVSSAPQVTVQNTSDKTILSFMLVVRDPDARIMRSRGVRQLSIPPGGKFTVPANHKMDSEKYWIPFSARSNFYVTIGAVTFDDGTRWLIKEEGEIR